MRGERGGWRDTIAPEYRKIADKFVTPADVVRSYAELERKLGSAVHVPGEQADEAERARFYERIGRPKRVEDYAIDVPADLPEALQPDETGEGRQRRFLEHAHRAGLTRNQAQAAINWYYSELANEHAQTGRTRGESFAQAEASLRSEWGATTTAMSNMAAAPWRSSAMSRPSIGWRKHWVLRRSCA